MSLSTPPAIRKQIAQHKTDSVYLIIGDDDVEMTKLAGDFVALVDEPLRVFNVDRLYAGDKGVTPASIVNAARTVPAMADRRVVVVLRAERLLKPKRRGRAAADVVEDDGGEPPSDLDVLESYVRSPVPETTMVLVASEVDRTRKVYKALQTHATIVECFGLRNPRDVKVDLRSVARDAETRVRKAVADAGQEIEPAAARLLAERAGTDIATLRGDLGRLLLYAAGRPNITLEDARQVVSAEISQDDWAVTNAIQRRDAPEALRQLALALEGGGVSFQILGQLAWYVREKLSYADARRVPGAVDAVFRTDLELKNSGDARVLLERLVVELCRG